MFLPFVGWHILPLSCFVRTLLEMAMCHLLVTIFIVMINDATTSHLCVLWNFHSQKNKQFEDLGAKLFAIGLRLCFGPYITLSFQPFPLGCSFTQNTSVT